MVKKVILENRDPVDIKRTEENALLRKLLAFFAVDNEEVKS